jgi:hypothetical protein
MKHLERNGDLTLSNPPRRVTNPLSYTLTANYHGANPRRTEYKIRTKSVDWILQLLYEASNPARSQGPLLETQFTAQHCKGMKVRAAKSTNCFQCPLAVTRCSSGLHG